MRYEEPLDDWLLFADMSKEFDRDMVYLAKAQKALDRLTAFLDNPPTRGDLIDAMSEIWNWSYPMELPPDDVTRAQELYRRVYNKGGKGSTYAQRGLLGLLACAQDTAVIPFWLEILEYKRERDRFTNRRRVRALAALALLAIGKNDPQSYETLWHLARHPNPDIRGQAVYYLGEAYQNPERPLPPEAQANLTRIAAEDTAFEPRFQARSLLRAYDLPIPFDNPGGVYAFKTKFKWENRIYRTIELRSEQTLDDLHFAIQRSIHWDADHLYSFYMNGEKYDRRYAYACPYEDDHPPWTDDAIIGELGLVKKHKFLYYFDYGDSREFEIEVVDIQPQADEGKYPRVVDSKGEAPAQYGW